MSEHRNARPGEPARTRQAFKGSEYKRTQQLHGRVRLFWDGTDARMQALAAGRSDRQPLAQRIRESVKRAVALGLGKLRRRAA